jgi:ElaB/YqjD/DUF883 family membrane-anchored ribosome-binding protein
MAKISDFEKDLRTLQADVKSLGEHVADVGKHVADVSKDTVNSTVHTSKKFAKNAAKQIEKNPVATLAGALGLGVVLGGIFKRLFRRRR